MAVQTFNHTYGTPRLRIFYQISGVLILIWFLVSRGQISISFPLYPDLDAPLYRGIHRVSDHASGTSDLGSATNNANNATLVIASVKSTNTSWLRELPHFDQKIYVVDDWNAEYKVPLNKGNEAMVFLTYIIDHYHELSPITLFLHANRFQWHNDDPDYDNLNSLRRLKMARVLDQGYVNLRCVWRFGCDVGVNAIDGQRAYEEKSKSDPNYVPDFVEIFAKAWEYLMPGRIIPDYISVACCAQFAASRDAIHGHSRDDYLRYREWIMRSKCDDATTGRVFEYLWHILFGKEARSCPTAESCYCDTYGICDLKCKDSGEDCGVYVPPPGGQTTPFPKEWPNIGWDGQWRHPHEVKEGFEWFGETTQ